MNEKKEKELQMFDQLKELLCKDIKSVIAKGDITPPDYQALDTAVDIYKDAVTIRAMIEYDMPDDYMQGYTSGAMRSSWDPNPNGVVLGVREPYYGTNSWDDGMGGNSYARGRSMTTGRYVSRDDEIGSKLNHMMQTATSEQERQMISRLMNEMGR